MALRPVPTILEAVEAARILVANVKAGLYFVAETERAGTTVLDYGYSVLGPGSVPALVSDAEVQDAHMKLSAPAVVADEKAAFTLPWAELFRLALDALLKWAAKP